DLGCGKGAVSVELADELGYQVTGVELFEPFIAGCEALADQNGVSSLCTFRHGDVLTMAPSIGTFDVAVCAALGDVLGGPDETIAVLREVLPEVDSESASDSDEADDEASMIHARAVALAEKYPEHRAALMSFAADQARENAFIDENFVDVIWVLRRS
ncbi:MAG: class I SAM-dependent methyltransferase, partial [Pseudomonadales bacterium]